MSMQSSQSNYKLGFLNKVTYAPVENENGFLTNIAKSEHTPRIFIVLLLLVFASTLSLFTISLKTDNQSGRVSGVQESQEYEEVINSLEKVLYIDRNQEIVVERVDDPNKYIDLNPEFYSGAKGNSFIVILKSSKRIILFDKQNNQMINISSFETLQNFLPENI